MLVGCEFQADFSHYLLIFRHLLDVLDFHLKLGVVFKHYQVKSRSFYTTFCVSAFVDLSFHCYFLSLCCFYLFKVIVKVTIGSQYHVLFRQYVEMIVALML